MDASHRVLEQRVMDTPRFVGPVQGVRTGDVEANACSSAAQRYRNPSPGAVPQSETARPAARCSPADVHACNPRGREGGSMKDLAGHVAVITGAGSGLGKEFARFGAAERMKLVLADVQQEALDDTVAEVRGAGAEALGMRIDVSVAADVE